MRSCAVRCKGTTEEEWNGPGHDTGVAPTLALPVSGPPRSCETSALLQTCFRPGTVPGDADRHSRTTDAARI